MTPETAFKVKIQSYLDSVGAWHIKYWAGAKYTKEGIPDILASISGKFYGIEAKADGGKPSLLQLVNLGKIRESGGIGVLLYPEDLECFILLIHGSDIGQRWYVKNIEIQREWFEKLNK